MSTKHQFNFSRGVIAPEFQSRVDIAMYHAALSELINGFIMRSGGVSDRAGTDYLDSAPDDVTDVRLIPFKETDDRSYVLVLMNNTVRVFRDGKFVLGDDGLPFEMVWELSDEELSGVKFDQKYSFMTLVHPDKKPKEIKLQGEIFSIDKYEEVKAADSNLVDKVSVWLNNRNLS